MEINLICTVDRRALLLPYARHGLMCCPFHRAVRKWTSEFSLSPAAGGCPRSMGADLLFPRASDPLCKRSWKAARAM